MAADPLEGDHDQNGIRVSGDLFVPAAPFAVRTDLSNELQPDVLVARRDELTERMGTPSYWILDPEVPDLLVLELDPSGTYQEVAHVADAEGFSATQPFEVRVVPADLLRRLDR